MNVKSNKIIFIILLIICIIGLVILFGADTNPIKKIFSTQKINLEGFPAKGSVNLDSQVKKNGGLTPLRIDSTSIFNQKIRSLLSSNDLTKIDYARLRLSVLCTHFQYGADVKKTLMTTSENEAKTTSTRLLGNATLEVRSEAFSNSIKKCSDLYEGRALSDDENIAFKAQPQNSNFRVAAKSALQSQNGLNDLEISDAQKKALSTPMFGVIESLLYTKIDYSPITKNLTPEQAASVSALVAPIVLCNLGDDCGPGGLVTDQLCWMNAICGKNAEDAIFASLTERGVDIAAFNQFLSQINISLQNRDVSIFNQRR
jgi:hypothetical protein